MCMCVNVVDHRSEQSGLLDPVWYENLSGVLIDGLDSVVIGSRDQ